MKVCCNGEFSPANQPVLTAANPVFKWGEGLFETMKVVDQRIILANLHFERLLAGLSLLQINIPSSFTHPALEQKIIELCGHNNCLQLARVRLAVYPDANNAAAYVIEAIPLEENSNNWQTPGLSTTTFSTAKKATDVFANLKSSNYLPYRLAAKYAMANGLDDCLVLNTYNRYCDSSKANIFLVKNDVVFTPSLSEGCINGVMRNVIIAVAKKLGYVVEESKITKQDLLDADEVFLSNAIQIIRWVKFFEGVQYTSQLSRLFFKEIEATIFIKPC